MHMADALVAPAVAATMYVCSGGAAGFSVKKVRLESDPKKIPVMGVMGAFVFAAQMINFTIPGTGSSGHLCGGMMLTALLGPYAAFLTMIGVLLIQCLLFADGGLLALGCNIWNMAFYGCFLGYFLFWRPLVLKVPAVRRLNDRFSIPVPRIHHIIVIVVVTLMILLIQMYRDSELHEVSFAMIFFLIFLNPSLLPDKAAGRYRT